ncbi:MAG TPA: hypothetical protein VJB39_00105 [Patescibacteria group bacterium]|nr:hypothetical protein [Patescibacteria group bacterium]
MTKKTNHIIIWVIIGLAIVGLIALKVYLDSRPGELDQFARCLGENGAIFYGAFWCSHCQAQKAMFGRSDKLLPYVECSTPNGQGQLQICQDKNVESYPTWEFADGSRLTGEIALSKLAEKTACELYPAS